MPRLPERTDGRRKGYRDYKATVYERVDPEVRKKLDQMRAGYRKNTDRKNTDRKPT